MQKPIGIFGGTFDPIHNGHLHVAEEIYQRLHLQEVRLIPCFQPVHRSKTIASPEQRLAMIKLAIASKPGLIADDREIERDGKSYTVDTLNSLRQEFNNLPLCLIMATDAFLDFDQWHRWQEIPNLAHLVVVKRPGYTFQAKPELKEFITQRETTNLNLLRQTLSGYLIFIDIHSLPISGTEIRRQLAGSETPPVNLIPKSVYDYIKKQNLYQTNSLA